MCMQNLETTPSHLYPHSHTRGLVKHTRVRGYDLMATLLSKRDKAQEVSAACQKKQCPVLLEQDVGYGEDDH